MIAWTCAGISVGVFVSRSVAHESFSSLLWLLVGVGLVLLAVYRGRRYMVLVALLGGAVIGVWRATPVALQYDQYADYIGREVSLTGRVMEDTDVTSQGQAVLRIDQIQIDGLPLGGKVWVTTDKNDAIQRNDHLQVVGVVNEGFGTFAAAMYRAEIRRHTREQGVDPALVIRDRFSDSVQKSISEPAVSLGLGFLTGQRRGLPPELLETLQIAGLTHIIVASGYNLTILVRIARRICARTSKYLATVIPAGLVLGFIAVTGASPSMSRAGLVTGLSILAWYYGRQFHPAVLLSVVAAVSLIVNPTYGWGDLGWLLSFAAFIGVMVIAPLCTAFFFGDTKPPLLQQVFTETLSAHIMTLPIILLSFGTMSNVALVANICILPLIPIVMAGVFGVGMVGFVSEVLAGVVAVPVQYLLQYMVWIATTLADQSWAQSEYEISIWTVVLCYACVTLIGVYMAYSTGFKLRSHNIIE